MPESYVECDHRKSANIEFEVGTGVVAAESMGLANDVREASSQKEQAAAILSPTRSTVKGFILHHTRMRQQP